MKALTLSHPSLTREILLRKADETPGAWVGIRDTHCGLVVDFVGLEIVTGRRVVRFDPLGGGKVDTESEC